jgi:hypothetical protein
MFHEDLERFQTAFSALGSRARSVISYKLVDGLSHEDIGRQLGVTAAHSRVLLARAPGPARPGRRRSLRGFQRHEMRLAMAWGPRPNVTLPTTPQAEDGGVGMRAESRPATPSSEVESRPCSKRLG